MGGKVERKNIKKILIVRMVMGIFQIWMDLTYAQLIWQNTPTQGTEYGKDPSASI